MMRLGLFEAVVGRFADGQPIGNVSFQNHRMQSILDHVSRLLNARRGMVPHLDDYGLPDIQEVYQAMPNSVAGLGREIRETIERYEPRLRKVEVIEQPTREGEYRITFLIRAEVIGGERLRFYTMFSTGGNARVNTEPGGAGD